MLVSRRRFASTLIASAALSGCVSTSPTGRTAFTGFYSEEDDIRIGKEEGPKLTKEFGGAYTDPRIDSYVTEVGLRLAVHTEHTNFPYKFTILNSSIINAFALPGGQVFISRGLLALASNEAEMAGVLAHELGHVNARHTAERLSKATLAQVGLVVLSVAGGQGLASLAGYGAQAYLQGFSRDQEFEADLLGVRYMSKAGYEPDAMVSFLNTLRDHSMLEARMMGLPAGKVDEYNVMSTHPRTVDRVKEAQAQAQVTRQKGAAIRRQEYLDRINGMLYGDDPEQGISQGRRFVHPKMRFEYEVPEGFRLVNSPTKVTARHPDGGTIVFDTGHPKRSNSPANYIRNEWLANSSSLSNLDSITVNGIPAATATTKGSMGNKPVDVRVVALQGDGSDMFRLAFIAPSGKSSAWTTDFQRTTYSFRRLSAEEAAKVQAQRLIVVPVGKADSADKLAQTLPFGKYNGEAFRLLNDLQPGQEVTPGQPIKVIAG
ncbi:MAG: M48 family metalloprotease [Magnetospirillum sp. WYHS-4]